MPCCILIPLVIAFIRRAMKKDKAQKNGLAAAFTRSSLARPPEGSLIFSPSGRITAPGPRRSFGPTMWRAPTTAGQKE